MKSYSEGDYQNFRCLQYDDIARGSQMLVEKQRNGENLAFSKEEFCLFRGIEVLLAPNLLKRFAKIKKARKVHIEKVLAEQARQRNMNICSVVAIARVSKKSSHSERVRSYKVAVAAIITSV